MSASRLREAANRLREVAGAATPGPWVAKHRDPDALDTDIIGHRRNAIGGERGSAIHLGDPGNPTWGSVWPSRNARNDAAYIATMAPPVALALAESLTVCADAYLSVQPGNYPFTLQALRLADAILADR